MCNTDIITIIDDYRLHAANIEANNVTQSSNVNIFPYFPMEETRKEEIHKGIELQHMTDKSDEGNVLYKDVDDDESDILTQESATSSQDRSSFLISPYWLQDERLRRGVVDFLSNDEEEFWKDLIGKYLQPIESDEESQVSWIFFILQKKRKENRQNKIYCYILLICI